VLGAAADARAGVISTGVVSPVGDNEVAIQCTVANVGKKFVAIEAIRIVDPAGGEFSKVSPNCNPPGNINPGQSCVETVVPNPSNGASARCEVDFKGGGRALRVCIMLRDLTTNSLAVACDRG
jgi:hypothetical protein